MYVIYWMLLSTPDGDLTASQKKKKEDAVTYVPMVPAYAAP